MTRTASAIRVLATLAILATLAVGGLAQLAIAEQQQSPFPAGEQPVQWVTTEWLAQHLDDAELKIIDVQPDVHDYFAEHIPGAVYMTDKLLRMPDNGLPAQYIPEDAMEILFQEIGVEANTPIVVYTGTGAHTDTVGDLQQTMMAYTLARFGHDNVHLLDGGLDKWRAEERPLAQEFPTVQPSEYQTDIRPGYFIEYPQFKTRKDQDNVVVTDARPPEVYSGEGPWIKEGHIPGAINVPWRDMMATDNPTLLKPRNELMAMLEEKGITPDKTVLVSCGTGREATNQFLVLKYYLGYPGVQLYEGSFTEWTAHPENPTVTGSTPG